MAAGQASTMPRAARMRRRTLIERSTKVGCTGAGLETSNLVVPPYYDRAPQSVGGGQSRVGPFRCGARRNGMVQLDSDPESGGFRSIPYSRFTVLSSLPSST